MIRSSIRHRLLLSVLLGGLCSSCSSGPVAHRVDTQFLRGISHAGQISIYDAENEIMVARDRVDTIREQLAELEPRRRHAARRLKLAEERKTPAGIELAQAWIGYLDSVWAWLNADLSATEEGVRVAHAALELTKADVIQREDLVPGKNFSVADYRAQRERLGQVQQLQVQRTAALRRNMQEKDAEWWAVRRRYMAQTGDNNRGLWID